MKHIPVESERRIITILAVDIVKSMRHIADCDPDDAQIFFDRCFDHMRKSIEAAGGTMVSFEGDGGVAAFGWPSAHEDHADRACAAAWDIQHRGAIGAGPDGRSVQFRVGVHSGLVALRQIRRGGRSRLETAGATVHVAAKLQQSAEPGAIRISAEAVHLCRAALDVAPKPVPPTLDGRAASVFSLEAPPRSRAGAELGQRYAVPMVGRQPELATLHNFLPRLGRNAAVAIIGEPGIGKSRLAAAAVADAIALDARILVFFGDMQKRTTPFATARSLIDGALAPPDGMSVDRALAALAAAGVERRELEAIHPSLRPPGGKRREKRAQLTKRQLSRLLAKAFCALAIDRPTLVLVEDLHLVDPESREFLTALTETAMPHSLSLMLTGRPESAEWAQEITKSVVRLEPLPKSAMKAIGRLLVSRANLSRPTLDLLVTRADGIPLVLEELIHALDNDPGRCATALPQGIGSLIHVRLQRLTPDARELAHALSLLGTNADVELAGDLLGRTAATVLRDLAELERFAFVHPIAGGSIRMRHQIIAEACAETIPHRRRKELHEGALRAIKSRYEDLGGRYEQLAFHAEGTGDAGAALEYLWQAALEARRNSAASSLSLIFDRAMALIEAVGEAAEPKYLDFALIAFASMVQIGEFDKVNRHLPRLTELARRSGKPALISSTLSHVGMMCWFEGRYEDGLRATEEGLAIARELGSPVLIYANLIMQTNLLHGMGHVARAIEEQRELCSMLTGELETARLGAASLPSATAQSFLSWFMMDAGRYSEGMEFAERGLALAVREGDAYAEALARHALARNFLMLHRNSRAVDCLAQAREISERNGYDAIRANLDARMAIALTRCGRAAEAVGLVEECLRRKLHRRTGKLEVYSLNAAYAESLLRLGEIERGLAALAEALAIARKIHNPCLIVDALGLRARMLSELAPGDPRIDADVRERASICESYGLPLWPEWSSACSSGESA